ncbi:Unannotated [Lentimonas sp. CC4]|nr:Unannotated [Lentimonas sp. CC4]CAA6684005.1 Unannotated [Lentimonas sp. CC6]CAA7076619.1 Unannotated [Lentimonas sp. CC4]CAA7170052.1 Unannotated [Lentimonas sp. CC21]CAA7181337.1 Unannotated [Lentimonas sp. CC8]
MSFLDSTVITNPQLLIGLVAISSVDILISPLIYNDSA